MFNPFDPDDWNNVLGVLGQGFTNFGNLVANGGASLVGTIGNGVIGIYKDAAGDIAYAFDATKSTAIDIGHWTEGAAGTVEDFSIDSYSKAKDGLTTAWQALTAYLLQDLPALGPYDATARDCMKYLMGGSEAAISGWESSARAIGYTMAFDVGASVQVVGQTSAFSGIYVDRSGLWGFFPGSQSSAPPVSFPSASVQFEMYMVFGGKDSYGSKCYQVGLKLELPVSFALSASLDGQVLLTPGFAFKGFRVGMQGSLSQANLSGGVTTSVSAGAPDPSVIAQGLVGQAAGHDAAVRALNDPTNEPKMIASAGLSTLPFVSDPASPVYIQVKGSRLFYDVPVGTDNRPSAVYQNYFYGGSGQLYLFKDNGDGTYGIVPTASNVTSATFDISDGTSIDRDFLFLKAANGSSSQRFQVMGTDSGWFYLLNKNSAKVMASRAAAPVSANNEIAQQTWNHDQSQMVRFFSTRDIPALGRSYTFTNAALNQQLSLKSDGATLTFSPARGSAETWKVVDSGNRGFYLQNAQGAYLGASPGVGGVSAPGAAALWGFTPTDDGCLYINNNQNLQLAARADSSFVLAAQDVSLPPLTPYLNSVNKFWALPESGRAIVSFVVDAPAGGVYILLTTALGNTNSSYEIIIGDASNTQTVIRRGPGGATLAAVPVGLAAPGGSNPLWLAIDKVTGRIDIGRGLPGRDIFLSYKDPSFIAGVSWLYFGTYLGPLQCTQVNILPVAAKSSLAVTACLGHYEFGDGWCWTLPQVGRGTVAFTANATNDVIVTIADQKGLSGQLYEIDLGGWANTRSVIRRGPGGPELAAASVGLLAPGQPNPLWVSIDSATGTISIGHGLPGQDVFLSYKDPSFIAGAQYVTFTAVNTPIDYSQVTVLGLGATLPGPRLGWGQWRLGEVSSVPAGTGVYDYSRPAWKLPNGRGVFSFTVNQCDASILLTPTAGSGSGYEIVLGAASNTRSIVRRGVQGPEIVSANVGLTALGQSNPFWISIDNRSGLVQVGRNAPGQDVFLSFFDATLRSAAPVTQWWVYLSAKAQPIQYGQIAVAPITANVSPTAPGAPRFDWQAWMANLPLTGSSRWVSGCAVRYAVAHELADGSELRGPWWNVTGSDANGYFQPSYSLPTLTNVAVDPSNRAVARRIYRQFRGDATETLVARLANNVDTRIVDGEPARLLCFGSIVLGDNYTTGVKRVGGLSVPNAYGHAPAVVITTPRGENYPDTFTLSTSGVGRPNSTVNVYRLDALSRWGQNVLANVLSCDAMTLSDLQTGSVSYGSSSSACVQRTISFPAAFAQAPFVLVTARGQDCGDTFAATVIGISPSAFTFSVQRVDSAAGWGQNLGLDWVAFTPSGASGFRANQSDCGEKFIGSGPTGVLQVPVSFNHAFASPPTLHMTARGDGYIDVFAITVINVTTTGFIANLKRADAPANGWGQNLKLHWLALL